MPSVESERRPSGPPLAVALTANTERKLSQMRVAVRIFWV